MCVAAVAVVNDYAVVVISVAAVAAVNLGAVADVNVAAVCSHQCCSCSYPVWSKYQTFSSVVV